MEFGYFGELQSEQFAFFRIPKILYTDDIFKGLSTDGKVLYGHLLDRVSLSRENGWIDENGHVYIIFTLASIQKAMSCSDKTATKYLTELEEFGLIERVRRGQGKPTIIYVKNFSDSKYLRVQNRNISGSGIVESPVQDSYFLRSNNTNINHTDFNNTDFNNTDPILSTDEDRMRYEAYLNKQLELEALKVDYPYDVEILDGIKEILLDILCSDRKKILIAGDYKPVNVVKSRLMKLDVGHIRYVMECMQENTAKIRNIKQYLLAALYNAPATIDSFYKAEVNRDMAEGKI